MIAGKPPTARIHYRPDIDGIRAVAVLGVMVFHINPDLLKGGFLGVDMFFAISGYLITLLLLKESESGAVDIGHFYRRRIQRIIPALLFVLCGSALAGYLLFAPEDFRSLATATLSSILSVANMHFYMSVDTGYFASGSQEIPLLHLWSLGVEEQFYLLWPFVLTALVHDVKSTRIRVAFVSAVLIISFSAAIFFLGKDTSFAYYMLPTRAWELMFGCVAALLVHGGLVMKGKQAEIAATCGIALITYSLFSITKADGIPGVGAIPAVLGATLLIIAGGDTLIGRALSVKPLVAIGLVSYSAYLWHWPILAYLRYSFIDVSLAVGAVVFVGTFAMAFVSFRFVERPLRKLKLKKQDVFIRYFVLPVSMIILSVAAVIRMIDHKADAMYPWQDYKAIASKVKAPHEYEYNCQDSNFALTGFSESRCVFPKDSRPSTLLIGDSNAAHYLGLLRVLAHDYGFSFRNATRNGCPMIFSEGRLAWAREARAEGCVTYRALARREVGDYETVIVGGDWTFYDREGGETFRRQVEATLTELSTRIENVVVLGKVPVFSGFHLDCEKRRVRMAYLNCDKGVSIRDKDHEINVYLRKLAGNFSNVHFFDVRHVLCQQNSCSPYLAGVSIYFDTQHLSMEGSAAIGNLMVANMDPMAEKLSRIITRGKSGTTGIADTGKTHSPRKRL